VFGNHLGNHFKKYVDQARSILEQNWTGEYTKPSPSLYPHQWNWDSGFIAIGYSHYDQDRAQQEIVSLFKGQWPNGMVPQIVFNSDALGNYFPEPDFWQVPGDRMTSGISMPPLHAIACLQIHRNAQDVERSRSFLKYMYPKLLASHRYFYKFRDPDEIGLVYIRHPWESGLDNSPAWDGPLSRITIDKAKLPSYQRRDLKKGVPADQRPSNDDYDRYVFLVDLFRRSRYEEEVIRKECPFLIQEVLLNSILCRANRDLVEIGNLLGDDVAEARSWTEQTAKSISRELWCDQCSRFEDMDLVTREFIHVPTAAGFSPLFGGAASREQADAIYGTVDSVAFCALNQGHCYTIPNYDMTQDDFDPKNYWRGPVWININWMLAKGLKDYQYVTKADLMEKDIMQLPMRFGFHEYFDSTTGQGYGSAGFSWTAALFLDLVYSYYDRDRDVYEWFQPVASRGPVTVTVLNQRDSDRGGHDGNRVQGLMKSIRDIAWNFHDMDRSRINYAKLKKSEAFRTYRELAASLDSFSLELLISQEERLAFWINMYNSMVIHAVIELDVVSSVKEITGFFESVAYRIGDYIFTLDDIEHGILRANSKPPQNPAPCLGQNDERKKFVLDTLDPRIHFALGCGVRSRAPFAYYDAGHIHEQLDRASTDFVNSAEVIILPEKMAVYVSQIFLWYEDDFGGNTAVLNFIARYLQRREKAEFVRENLDRIRMEYLFYDWSLDH
jgi:hypothetical protein